MTGSKTSTVLTLVTSCAITMTALASSAHAAAIYWNSAYSGGTWTDTGGTGWNTTGTGYTYNQPWGYGGNYDANFTGTAGSVTVSGTISSVNSITFSTGSYTIGGGTIDLTGAGGQITTTTSGESTNDKISSNLSGNVGLTKLGSSTLTLSGVNTYTGGTTISAGTLSLGSSSAIGSSGTITFGGGTLQLYDSTDYSSRFSTAAGQAYNINTNGQSVTLATALTSSGGTLTKTGSGTLILSVANTYSGLTTVSAGELDLNDTSGNSIAGNLTVSGGTAKLFQANQIRSGQNLVLSGGTFDLQGYNQTVANVQLTGGSIIGSGGILTSATAYDMRAGSVSAIFGGSVALNKTTSGTVTLSGANTYTGGTTISAGTLSLGSSGAIGSSGTITFGGGALQLYDSTDYSSRFSTAVGQAYNIDTNGQSVTLATGLTSSGGALNKIGSGTLTLASVNSYSGSTTVSGGTLAVTRPSSLPGYTTGGKVSVGYGATLAVNVGGPGEWAAPDIDVLCANAKFYNGYSYLGIDTTDASSGFAYSNMNGGFGLTKLGPNTLTLSGANAYYGSTMIDGGRLLLTGGNDCLPTTTSVTLANVPGAVLDLNGQNQTLGVLSGGGNSGGNVTIGSGTLTVGNSLSYSSIYNGVMSGTGGSLIKVGPGFLTLSGANTYTGTTTISAGTLELSGGNNRLPITTSVTLANAPGAELDLNGQNQTIASLRGGGSSGGNVDLGSGTLTLDSSLNGAPDTIYGGIIRGYYGGSVTKQGANTVTLSGANIYTGTTTINSGTLALGVNNALPTASNMILGGGTLATNSFSQTNALGTLALSSNSSIDMAILGGSILKFSDSHSTSWSGTLTINDWNGFFSGGGADELFFGSSESALSLSQLNEIVFTSPNGLSGNYEARILVTGEVVPGGILAPEPGTVALLVSGGLSLGGLALRRWRRRTISA